MTIENIHFANCVVCGGELKKDFAPLSLIPDVYMCKAECTECHTRTWEKIPEADGMDEPNEEEGTLKCISCGKMVTLLVANTNGLLRCRNCKEAK
jgi:hypothetical protein